jgi:hypothetical protein
MPLTAGAAVADITPPPGTRMDGYGGRLQGATEVHDPLAARALVLQDGAVCIALVSLDLLGMHPEVTRRVRERLARSGVSAVTLAATHNHAGPAGLRGGMFSRLDEELAAALVDRVCAAVESAGERLKPATLKAGRAVVDTVSMNRRDPDGPIDPVLGLVLVDGEDGPIATIVNFACHATVLSGANLALSGEFPGAAARLLLAQTGAPCIYLNGACGDVNPVWIRQDFESVERAGQIVGAAALRLAAELRALGPGQRAHNIRWDEFPEKTPPGRIVTPGLRAASAAVRLPLREFAADEHYAALIADLEARLDGLAEGTPERRALMAELTRARNERWAAAWARNQAGTASLEAEVQALLLGDGLAVLALPGEFFAETGEAIRRASGVEDLLLACYANDYIGYVIPDRAYAEGGYEAGITFCAPGAEAAVREAAAQALRDAGL